MMVPLLDLEPKKEAQLTNHRHLELHRHHFTKLMVQSLLSAPKNDIINEGAILQFDK